jgi:hypothetical protein
MNYSPHSALILKLTDVEEAMLQATEKQPDVDIKVRALVQEAAEN